MIQPPFLKPGDKIGIVAPGRKVLQRDIEVALKKFASWGLEVVLAKNIFSEGHSYLAGTDAERIEDLQTMLDDSSIKAIISARGGYGSTRIIDQLDFSTFLKHPKWIAGFSDITAIHLKLFSIGCQSIHGTMPIVFSKPDALDSVLTLKSTLFGEGHVIQAGGSSLNREGTASGLLVGGNLSLVVDAIGTATDVDTNGKILVLEEIDEYLYRIDRMLIHMKRAGKLKNLSGLLIGHMTDLLDTELRFGETISQIILSHVKEYNYPVGFNFPSGHEQPNLSWPHGSNAQLDVNRDRLTLSFDLPS